MQPEDVRYRIIRLIEQRPEITQRELASELGVSLGKVNYCLRALIDKGHIKLNKFRRRSDKSHYLYVLTPAGIQHRAAITVQFLRRKMDEYEQLRCEIEALSAELERDSKSPWISDSFSGDDADIWTEGVDTATSSIPSKRRGL